MLRGNAVSLGRVKNKADAHTSECVTVHARRLRRRDIPWGVDIFGQNMAC